MKTWMLKKDSLVLTLKHGCCKEGFFSFNLKHGSIIVLKLEPLSNNIKDPRILFEFT